MNLKAKYTLIEGDASTVIASLPRNHYHCVVTSPPYYKLREYDGHDDTALGHETSSRDYIRNLVKTLALVRETMREDGILWLNIGDTTANGPCGRQGRGGQRADRRFTGGRCTYNTEVPRKNLLLIPQRLASSMQRDGWIIRSFIPWLRRNSMPESTRDRPSCSIEYIIMAVKKDKYYYDLERNKVPVRPGTPARHAYDFGGIKSKQLGSTTYGRNRVVGPRAVPTHRFFRAHDLLRESLEAPFGLVGTASFPLAIDVPHSGTKIPHFAVFTPALIRPLIRASTSEHGCCSVCGAPLARIIEKKRVPTRPGTNTKLTDANRGDAGNRDPLRHVTVTTTTGWKRTCKDAQRCREKADAKGCPRRVACRVLDFFCGVGTAGIVAASEGCSFTGIDLSSRYLSYASRALRTPIRKG